MVKHLRDHVAQIKECLEANRVITRASYATPLPMDVDSP